MLCKISSQSHAVENEHGSIKRVKLTNRSLQVWRNPNIKKPPAIRIADFFILDRTVLRPKFIFIPSYRFIILSENYGPSGQSVKIGSVRFPSNVCPPLPIPLQGLIVPPNKPFWQSKIKQKLVAVNKDSPRKLLHPVPGPASKNPPLAKSPKHIDIRRERFRIIFFLWNPRTSRENNSAGHQTRWTM